MRLRTWNHRLSPFKRQQACGRIRRKKFGVPADVVVRRSKWGTAHISGPVLCGSVWTCPVCSYVICRKRAEELRTALRRHSRIGGGDCLATLTLPHDDGDELRPIRQHVARAWQFCISGAPWKRFAAKLGITGYVRAAEPTHGPNGWHPHLHVVLFTRRPLTDAQREEIAAFLFKRWARAIAKPHKETGRTFRAPLEFGADGSRVGVTCTTLGREDYIAKLGLADELASGATKRARAGHRTPFQILHDIWAADGRNDADAKLWTEFAGEMQGAKQLTWSKDLRKRYGRDWIELDLDVVEQAADGGEDICDITEGWSAIADDVGAQIRIVQFAENYDRDEAADRIQRLIDKALGRPEVPF